MRTFPISFNTFPIDHQISSRSWKMLIAADWLVMLITADDAGIFLLHFHHFLALAFSSNSDTFYIVWQAGAFKKHIKGTGCRLDSDIPSFIEDDKNVRNLDIGLSRFELNLNNDKYLCSPPIFDLNIWIFDLNIWIFDLNIWIFE